MWRVFQRLADSAEYVDRAAFHLAEARSTAPFGARPEERYLDVNVSQGTLVVYDAGRPLFATLISPGKAGLTSGFGKTPRGVFRISYKHHSAAMAMSFGAEAGSRVAEVPFIQYFHAPYALHGAYWHDRFGEAQSGGCINLSPADARTLFSLTLPQLPEGWNGVAALRNAGTIVSIHR